MNQTTVTTSAPETEPPTLAPTTALVTTANESESQTTSQTTVTPTIQDTTIQNTTTPLPTTNTTYVATKPTDGAGDDGSGSSPMSIVGGVIGGVVLILLVLALVIVIKRRRHKRRKSGNVPVLPGKDFIDSIHVENAVKYHKENHPQGQDDSTTKPYANLTANGETDPQTDPAVGPDGYLKKTKNFFNVGKHKHKANKKGHHHGKKKTQVADPPIYTNEITITKEPAKRTDSMPYNHAPPPPRDISGYATGRVAESPTENKDETNEAALQGYVNLQGQKKGETVFGVAPKSKNNDKNNEQNNAERRKWQDKESPKSNVDKNNHLAKPETEETVEKKVYENVTGGNYYNLKAEEHPDPQRQSTYENVGRESDTALQQDDVYENP